MSAAAARAITRPAVLPEEEQEAAREASRAMAPLVGRAVRVEAVPVGNSQPAQTFVLPAPAVKMLTEMLVHLGSGKPVAVIPDHAELTTQEAADFLNVSRPWVIQLIERGELQCRMVGTHRRLLFSELRDYKERTKAAQLRALDQLSAEAQEVGGYA